MTEIKVNLISLDGSVFTIDKKVGMQSELLREKLEYVNENENENIPLSDITGNILEKVIEYCEHHRDDKIDEYDYDDDENKDVWDSEYLERFTTKEDLFHTALAANFLNIKNLFNLTCRHIANNIKGKTVEEIREYFNIPYPEEEEENE